MIIAIFGFVSTLSPALFGKFSKKCCFLLKFMLYCVGFGDNLGKTILMFDGKTTKEAS